MEKRFTNKVVIVTGGSQGIGLACAKRFQEEGATGCAVQRSKSKNFESYEFDLSKEQDCLKSMEMIVNKHHRIDVLVNNAGMIEESLIEDMTLDSWNKTISLNLTAPFLMSKYAMPHLIKSAGSIVNIGSIEGLGANPCLLYTSPSPRD